MKYALANDQRAEAFPGGRGMCPRCNGEVIARCGTHRVHHWAHQGVRDCDSWTEKETEWHRAWKNKFAAECQEFIQHDPLTGERHIADVRTPHGLVIEFQHSHLDPQERIARERFYGNMLWVVDGTRLQRDYPRFLKRRDDLRATKIPGYFTLTFPDECLPGMWLDCSAPVVFDFRGIDERLPPDVFRETLWCLLPGRVERDAVVVGISRDDFVKVAPSRPQLLPVQEIIQLLREVRAANNATGARHGYQAGIPGRMLSRRHRRF